MKILLRILLVVAIILIVFFFSGEDVKENELLQAPNPVGPAIPMETPTIDSESPVVPRPEAGLSQYIGKSVNRLMEDFGEPIRVDVSSYGYDWWIYGGDATNYMMVGVKDETIVQVYIAGDELDGSPFQIGQSIDELFRFTIIESEINVKVEDNIFTFSIPDADMRSRILVAFQGIYAQVYIDQEDERVEAVRFMTPEVLVLHQPYEMFYSGEYIAPDLPSATQQKWIDEANARQIFDLTNVYREKHSVPIVLKDNELNDLSRSHSEDMAVQNYLSHDSPEFGGLSDRLKQAEIDYEKAGENIGSNYYDAAEVIHGWLNSKDHRSTLLDEDFTNMGSGAFSKYYTQVFIVKNDDSIESNQVSDSDTIVPSAKE